MTDCRADYSMCEYFESNGVPTDPLIVQASVLHPRPAGASLDQVNLYEGAVNHRYSDGGSETLAPGFSGSSDSNGGHTIFENKWMALFPEPSSQLYKVSIVVSEGEVDFNTAFGGGRLNAVNSITDPGQNAVVIGTGFEKINLPEVSFFSSNIQYSPMTLNDVLESDEDVENGLVSTSDVRIETEISSDLTGMA